MAKGDKLASGEQGDGVLWNIGHKVYGEEPDRERPMQEVLSDGSAAGWVEGDPPEKVDRFNPRMSSGPVGMGGSQAKIPATKPQVRVAAPRALSAQELHSWAEQELARLKAGEDAPIATRRLESGSAANGYNTELTDKAEGDFRNWKDKSAPWDTGEDYDLRGAYAAGYDRDKAGHLPDTFKKPNHETFSVESKYSKDAPDLAGIWEGDSFKEPEGVPGWLTKYMRGAK